MKFPWVTRRKYEGLLQDREFWKSEAFYWEGYYTEAADKALEYRAELKKYQRKRDAKGRFVKG